MTWRRAQMVLLSAQGMDVPAIAKVAFTSEDRVRDVIRNFNADGFGSLYPKYKGGRAPACSGFAQFYAVCGDRAGIAQVVGTGMPR
jgi:transposase